MAESDPSTVVDDRSEPSEKADTPEGRAAAARLLDRFLPAEVRGSPDDTERAQLAIAVGLLMVPVFLVLSILHQVAGASREALLNVLLALAMALAIGALKVTGRYFVVLNCAIAAAYAAMTAISIFERGAGITAATVALAEIPLFATLLAGVRTGAVWALASAIAIVGIGILGVAGIAVETTPPSTRFFDEHAALLVITGTLFFVATMYERSKLRSLQRIGELEQHRTRMEREKIEALAEVRVARAERFASLGRIAAAVAHEINNPLTYVTNNVEYVKSELKKAELTEYNEAIRDTLDGLERIRRIVTDLRAYTRPEDEELTSVDVRRALATALKMAEGHTRAKASVRTELAEVPRVVGNEARLVQVFLNLLVNAAQALPEGRAVENEIRVRVNETGGRVLVEVEDTGPGISPEIIQRITDPFFTTKPPGEGTGLGLALCESILKSAGGQLQFVSRPGSTIARVTLRPAPGSYVAQQKARSTAPPGPEEAPARLLVVDDELLVGKALQRDLRPHQVLVVNSGRKALELLRGQSGFDMILCDMMMPDLSGMDVYEQLRTQCPELLERVVFMTGGTFTERAEEFRSSVPNTFIDKPLSMPKVRALLAAYRSRRVAAEPENH